MTSDKKHPEHELSAVDVPAQTNTASDDEDMQRMGKKQSFQRNFQFISIAAFSVVAIAGWCYVPSTSTLALSNGGTGGIIIIFLINWFGLSFVVFSLAEMSSMAPTAGGQYHWASEFAPPSLQKSVSYFSGWFSCIAWQAGTAGGMFLAGTSMQGLIVATQPNYVPQPYQGFLFVVMIATFALVANTLLARYLPRLEGPVFVLFVLAFVAVLAVLWTMAPQLTAAEVFGTITKGPGWESLGLSLLVSQGAIMFLIVGSDATAHMAEETKNAAIIVPQAMITAYYINAGLAFIVIVTFCFVLVDYDSAIDSPVGEFGSPFIQVFVNATGSVAGGTALIAIMTVLEVLGIVNWMASNARQIFAFARDHGLPFGHWIAKVDAAGTYPVNSIIVVWTCVVLLNLITLGSVVAFEAIVSLQILALMSTYLVSMTCIIWRRIWGDPLPPSPWSLGRLGLPINVVGWCYCVFLIIFLPWPAIPDPPPEYMNWSCVMFGGMMILASIYYIVWARKIYKGPITLYPSESGH